MKKIIFVWICIVIGSGLFCAASEATEKAKITLKMATIQPRGTTLMKAMERYRAEIIEETNNEVDFKWYWGGVQGDEDDVLRKIRVKQLHGAAILGHGLGQIVPAVRVTEIPYVFWNRHEVTYVRDKLKETMEKMFEEKGYVILGWSELGFVYNFSAVPVTTVEELRNQKVWVWQDDPILNSYYRQFGVTPIPISVPDVMTSLSAGLINFAGSSAHPAVAMRWHTKFKYMYDLPVLHLVAGIFVRKDMFDKISPESQNKIRNIGKKYYEELIESSRSQSDECLQLLKREGLKIIHSEDTEMNLEYVSEIGRKARESLVGTLYSRELLDRTLALLAEYRQHHPNSPIERLK